jgi:hypothetical protein
LTRYGIACPTITRAGTGTPARKLGELRAGADRVATI